ncbi:YheC/YheD family protein [Paenibacillus sp. UNC499MF]|uniref:YheC/YheD family endospore coat-associated protein n=1 Tax=Paenibacillus sp. UNC499MF TaxID=1502751 RepID=UPI00089FE333|nr:YheC/YheD family protein [Paenibacillus sp. UNC499MF]SEG74438.1 YheC/D like ATP-grasp [Paenibacillus sp. UNC499MF]
MSLTTCTVHVNSKQEKSILVSGELAKALRLSKSKSLQLQVGSKTVTLPARYIKKSGLHLYLPQSVITSVKLPRIGPCLAASGSGKDIRLGPVIGILTNVASSASGPFGTRTPFIRSLMQPGERKSFHIAFSPKDVNWQQGTVNGYMLQPQGGWVRKTVPLPDVVYNRLPSRKAEKLISMEDFKQRFVKRNIPLFNWAFFDKWDVYRLLEDDPAFKYVPESVLGPSAEQLKDLLTRHKFIYLKPTAGSLGIGIYRITYSTDRGYFVRYRRNGKNVLLRFNKFEGLVKMLGINRGKLTSYVTQQGIRLIEIDGCPIDFRFHLTKNGSNQWVVAAIGAKKAGKGSVTTHLRNGGQLMTAEQALRQVYGSRSDAVLSRMKETSIELAEAIEKNYNHRLGELGFDLGIDQNEKTWMFEANAKPGRSIFKHPGLKAQDKASLNYIYEHCVFLSRFRARRDG